jgi:hypothetical protein
LFVCIHHCRQQSCFVLFVCIIIKLRTHSMFV